MAHIVWYSEKINKRSSKDPDDQIETKTLIDGESSKAELLQSSKCSSGDMTAVILTFTWSNSVKIWHWSSSWSWRLYNYTKRAFTGETTINQTKDMEEIECDSKVWLLEAWRISYATVALSGVVVSFVGWEEGAELDYC